MGAFNNPAGEIILMINLVIFDLLDKLITRMTLNRFFNKAGVWDGDIHAADIHIGDSLGSVMLIMK